MSGDLNRGSENVGDLLEIRERCMELKKEKEMLRDSQSQSFGLIRRLEMHVKTLSDAREEDQKHIQELERELNNCSQEIDYLQDQLNMKNLELKFTGRELYDLQLKLGEMESLENELGRLKEQLKISESERSLLMQEIEELRNSAEKLEESMLTIGLEYQCEIESSKLELISLDQNLFETKKLVDENSRVVQDLERQIQDAEKVIESLSKENKDLKEKVCTLDMNAKVFVQKIEEQLSELSGDDVKQSLSKLDKDISICGKILGPLLSKLRVPRKSDAELRKMDEYEREVDEYECLVCQLKEELREERLKAKEEAEELAQEMAELRYQLTGLLEEECKRRACVEQISLQRIAELEAQIAEEHGKSFTAQEHVVRNIHQT